MITKKEYKLTIEPHFVDVGDYMDVDKNDFDANKKLYWKQLRDRAISIYKFRYKNFKDGKTIIEDLGKQYHIGIKIPCQYKNYKSYLAESRDRILEILREVDRALGIKGQYK
jgi:hypothetical protein